MTTTRTLTTILGHEMTVLTPDHVGDKIASQGLYEKENLALLLALLRRIDKPVVLDIGANVGNHSLAFATEATRVHAFEPLPCAHRMLTENVARNGLDGIVITHHCALSDVEGSATFYVSLDGNLGASSFDKRHEQTDAIALPKRKGDAFLREHGVAHVDFLKIDVEAHESFVLRGLRETLERDLPIIAMEWNDPLTIARLRGSPEQTFLFEHYTFHVLGNYHDRGYWEGKPLAWLRRQLAKLTQPRRAVLYRFTPDRLYKNLLLIPKGREALLRDLEPLVLRSRS